MLETMVGVKQSVSLHTSTGREGGNIRFARVPPNEFMIAWSLPGSAKKPAVVPRQGW